MINHVNAKLSTDLKKSGFPQPAPQAGQSWYDEQMADISVVCFSSENIRVPLFGPLHTINWTHFFNPDKATYAPTLEDIAPLLPECVFEMWGEKPSCTNQNDEIPIRTFGATFAEAAAKMWLILYT